MAKGGQTYQKRQRESKVREKARLEREQCQEPRDEKKHMPPGAPRIDP